MFGSKHEGLTKVKISKTLREKGIRPPVQWGNQYWVGRHHEEKTRRLIGTLERGENNPFWNGGSSENLYPCGWTKALKTSIKERDGHTCQHCGKEGGSVSFDVHHTDYDRNNLDPWNLITLCKKCHSKTNACREEWQEFFNKLLHIQYAQR